MSFAQNEATLGFLLPEMKRERLIELANVEVVLLTPNLAYAIELQRTCVRWCIDYSWQIVDKGFEEFSESMDIALIDYDMGINEAMALAQKIHQKHETLPILLIGSKLNYSTKGDWPPNVGGSVLKSLGTDKVVEYMVYMGNGLHKS